VDSRVSEQRRVALEDTWRRVVVSGSLDDLRAVKRSLLTGGTAKTRTAGRQAFRDLQAATVQHVIDKLGTSVQRFPDGSPKVNIGTLDRAIREVGYDKLSEIIGPRNVRELKKLVETTRDVAAEPASRLHGSSTFANIVNFLDSKVGKIPGIGDAAHGLIQLGKTVHKMGTASRTAVTARETPLSLAEGLSRGATRKPSYAPDQPENQAWPGSGP
jgi:hypothetical protein